jgi:hypothetical protein
MGKSMKNENGVTSSEGNGVSNGVSEMMDPSDMNLEERVQANLEILNALRSRRAGERGDLYSRLEAIGDYTEAEAYNIIRCIDDDAQLEGWLRRSLGSKQETPTRA